MVNHLPSESSSPDRPAASGSALAPEVQDAASLTDVHALLQALTVQLAHLQADPRALSGEISLSLLDRLEELTLLLGRSLSPAPRPGVSPKQQSEYRELLRFVGQLDYPLAVADASRTILFPNRAYCEFVGATPDALVGKPLPQGLVAGDSIELESIAPNGKPIVAEWTLLRLPLHDQTVHLASVRDVSDRRRSTDELVHERERLQHELTDRLAELEGANALLQQALSEQRRSEETLRRSEQRNRALVQAIPDLVFWVNREGVLLDYEARFPDDLAMAPQEFLGKKVSDVLPPSLAQQFTKAIEATLQTGEIQQWEYELPVPFPNGPVHFYEARGIFCGADELIFLIRNIDDKKAAERQQAALVRGLRAVLEAVDELMAEAPGDHFYRRAVELAREKLGLERCSIYLTEADGLLRGTFGTDLSGRTTDERSYREPIPESISAWLRQFTPESARWTTWQTVLKEWNGDFMEDLGAGWVAHTPICSRDRFLGLFSNDTAISGAALDPIQQEILSIYASLVGGLLERFRSEEALVLSEEKYHTLFETIAQGVVYQDTKGRILSVNPAAERILGFSFAQMQDYEPNPLGDRVLRPDGTLLPVEEYPAFRALRTGQPVYGDIIGVRHADKKIRWIRVASIPQFRPGESQPYQVYSSFDDITALVETETALRASEARYRELYEQTQVVLRQTEAMHEAARALVGSARLPDLLQALANSAVKALSADHVMVAILDPQKQEVVKVVRDSVHPHPRPQHPHTFDELWEGLTGWVMRTGEPALSPKGVDDPRESRFVQEQRKKYSKNGSVAVVPVRYHGRILGTLTAINEFEHPDFDEEDLSLLSALAGQAAVGIENAHLQSETADRAAELARQTETLARSNADLAQFALVVSQDLQRPLKKIRKDLAQIQASLTGVHVAEDQLRLASTVADVDHLQRLLEDLSSYAQINIPRHGLRKTDVFTVLTQVLASMQEVIEASDARIVCDRLPTVLAHPDLLAQLFQQLLDNAIKFRGERPPRIEITAQRTDENWLFSVRDNGIGFPAHQSERIFKIFYRLPNAADRPGTGIGLAICKKIVEGHGGQIWAESDPGAGVTIYFTLPVSSSRDLITGG